MKGETKWEEAWRAFDADVQAANDAMFFTGKKKEPKELFDDISEEFDIKLQESCSENPCDYERAWRRLGAWIYSTDNADLESVCERYEQISESLGDNVWNEIAQTNFALYSKNITCLFKFTIISHWIEDYMTKDEFEQHIGDKWSNPNHRDNKEPIEIKNKRNQSIKNNSS